jgi:hypothetical protein
MCKRGEKYRKWDCAEKKVINLCKTIEFKQYRINKIEHKD